MAINNNIAWKQISGISEDLAGRICLPIALALQLEVDEYGVCKGQRSRDYLESMEACQAEKMFDCSKISE